MSQPFAKIRHRLAEPYARKANGASLRAVIGKEVGMAGKKSVCRLEVLADNAPVFCQQMLPMPQSHKGQCL